MRARDRRRELQRSSSLLPFRRVAAPAHPVFDVEAEREERDHLEQRDEGIDRKARERARRREAGVALFEALLDDAVQRDVLAHDERDAAAEEHRRADEIAE